MIIQENELIQTRLKDAFLLKPRIFSDERGEFCKIYTEELLATVNVKPYFNEQYISFSKKMVLRGMHYQTGEYAQAKLIRCVKGSVFDVIVDLRTKSSTFGKWYGTELSETNLLALYAPRGFAHGFLSLEEGSSVLYMGDNNYYPKQETGLIWNDEKIGIIWPTNGQRPIVSKKDENMPNFASCEKY